MHRCQIAYIILFTIHISELILSTINYCRSHYTLQFYDENNPEVELYGLDSLMFIKNDKDIEGREAYLALRNQMLRSGDTLVICSIDRLGRNKEQIKKELEYFKQEGIRVKILDIPTTLIDFPQGQEWVCDMVNNILIEVLGSIAQRERETIRSRQAAGIAEAKKDPSIKFGRPRAEKPDNWDNVITRWKAKEIKAVDAMKELGLTKPTFYKLVKEDERGA